MTTTIRLLVGYTLSGIPYNSGDLVSIDGAIATVLVNGRIADNNADAINRAVAEGEIIQYPAIDMLTYSKSARPANDILYFDYLSQRPSAAAYGVGMCQIDSAVYFSNGSSWKEVGDNKITSSFLSYIGEDRGTYLALPKGIKDCADWAIIGRAIDDNRINNVTSGILDSLFKRDYNAFVGENTDKWVITEATQGVFDYSRTDLVKSQVNNIGLKQSVHLIIGQNAYNPSWVSTLLAGDSTQLDSVITNRINSLKAKYPIDNLYRIDVVNEVLNESSQSTYIASRGWRLTNNAFYTAALVQYPSNPAQWIWNAFTQARAAWPSAKLCWNDFYLEIAHPCDSYNKGVLPANYRTNTKSGNTITLAEKNAFFTTNDRAALHNKINRARFEIWNARKNSIPIDVIGYQMHIDVMAPPNFDDFILSLQDWNRWGILPAITELNVRNSTTGGANILPPHLTKNNADDTNRYGAYLAYHYINAMLQNTRIEEICFWSVGFDTSGDGQTATNGDIDYPIRAAIMLALKKAISPALRSIKRGHRTNCRFALPVWITSSAGDGVSISQASNRLAITAINSLQIPWTFFNDTWMTMPIAANDLILSTQFQLSALIVGDAILMGYGNAASGTPTNGVYLIMNGTTLRVDVIVASVVVLTQTIASAVTTATDHRVAIRINGTSISYTYDGGAVGTATATGNFVDQLAVYLLSKADGSAFSANLSAYFFEVHHGADYNSNALLQTLSTNIIRDLSIGAYLGI